MRTCDGCANFASCFTQPSGIEGCLPASSFVEHFFFCPECWRKHGSSLPVRSFSRFYSVKVRPRLQYPLPSKTSASSFNGMDTTPMVLLSIYMDKGKHFSASIAFIEGQLHGYFHSKVCLQVPSTVNEVSDMASRSMTFRF